MNSLTPIVDASSGGKEPATGRAGWRGTGSVLVVEDDAAVRTLVARALPKFGFTASTAGNGNEALKQLKADPASYVLVLLDIKLPGMTPAEVVRRIRLIRADLPVIVMTGFDRDKALETLAGTAISGYIHKPFTLNGLASEIRIALGG